MTNVLILAEKGFQKKFLNRFHMFKKIEKLINIIRKEIKTIKTIEGLQMKVQYMK